MRRALAILAGTLVFFGCVLVVLKAQEHRRQSAIAKAPAIAPRVSPIETEFGDGVGAVLVPPPGEDYMAAKVRPLRMYGRTP